MNVQERPRLPWGRSTLYQEAGKACKATGYTFLFYLFVGVVDPGGFYPDPEPSFQKKTGTGSDLREKSRTGSAHREKKRIRIPTYKNNDPDSDPVQFFPQKLTFFFLHRTQYTRYFDTVL